MCARNSVPESSKGEAVVIDLHNHLVRYVVKLPVHATDPDMEVAVQMARIAEADGIRTIVSTPHFRPDRMGDEAARMYDLLHSAVETLNAELQQRGVEIEVLTGAEVAMSEMLPELADRKLLPTIAGTRHVLIELPQTTYAPWAEDMLFKLQLKGYTPVIAHFERLADAPVKHVDPSILRERGIKIQVNCESLMGKRGRNVQDLAQRLLREELASGLGTDAHDPENSPPLLTPCRPMVDRVAGRGTFDLLTTHSAAEIIRG